MTFADVFHFLIFAAEAVFVFCFLFDIFLAVMVIAGILLGQKGPIHLPTEGMRNVGYDDGTPSREWEDQ